jgi:predicted enzyme related to lactoylglutathione lyase
MSTKTLEHVAEWQELMSSNPETAKRFYSEVMGWSTLPIEGSDLPYTLWMHEGAPIAGLVGPRGSRPGWPSGEVPHWIIYVATEDVDQAARRAEALGGQILIPPADIPGVGRVAVLKDPEGAVFGVFTQGAE